MAVKTITVDLEAYELLAADKKPKESFSKVIKRRMLPKKNAKTLLRNLKKCAMSEEALARVDELLRARKDSYTDIPKFN